MSLTKLNAARNCIVENLNMFSDPNTQPERYNLYTALLNIIDSLKDIEDSMEDIGRETRSIKLNLP